MSDPIVILAGGVPIVLTYRDGTIEQSTVLKVSQRNMPRLAEAWCNQEKEVEVYLGKPPGWLASLGANDLSDDSFEAVMEKGRELNATPFDRYYRRQKAGVELIQAANSGSSKPTNS